MSDDSQTFACAFTDLKEVKRISTLLKRNYAKALMLQSAKPDTKKGEEILQNFCTYLKSINKLPALNKEALFGSITKVVEDYASSKKTLGRQMDFLNVFNSSGGANCREVQAGENAVEQSASFDSHMREALSEVMLSIVDSKCTARCDVQVATSDELQAHHGECQFRHEQCPHAGCDQRYSALHGPEHDQVCAYKLLPCQLGCEMEIARGQMQSHITGPCLKRIVACPFKGSLGCDATMEQGHLQEHCLGVGTHRHLSMAIARMDVQAQEINLLRREMKIEADARDQITKALGGKSMKEIVKMMDEAKKERISLQKQIDKLNSELKESVGLQRTTKQEAQSTKETLNSLLSALEKKGVVDRIAIKRAH